MKSGLTILCIFFLSQINAQKLLDNEEAYYKFATDIVIYHYDFLEQKADSSKRFRGKYGYGFFRIGDLAEDKNGIGKYYVIKSSAVDRTFSTLDQQLDSIPVTEFDSLDERGTTQSDSIVLASNVSDSLSANRSAKKKKEPATNHYYAVKVDDFLNDNVVARYYRWKPQFTVSTVIIPIKLRPKFTRDDNVEVPFEFNSDFTLGTSVGWKTRVHRYRDQFVNVLAGVGLTSISVDSASTKGFIAEDNLNLSAFTLSMGLVFEISGFQIGTFIGKDYLGGEVGPNWNHQKKTWVALGVGYQLMTRVRKEKD